MCTFPWVGLKWAVNRLFGGYMGREVLLAYQNEGEGFTDPNTPQAWANQSTFFKVERQTGNVNLQWIKVTTSDAELDTVELSPKETHVDDDTKKSRPHIIRFSGNTMRYKWQMAESIQEVYAHHCHIVLFDYRGVGLSRGKLQSQWDLVRDGVAVVRRLLDQGIPPEKITLDGHSLGGVVATLVAKYLYDRGIHVKVFSDRSLSSTTHFVVALIRGLGYRDGYHTSLIGRTLGWIAYPFIKLAVSLVDWDMEAGKVFRSLPPANREYFVLRSTKYERNDPAVANDQLQQDVFSPAIDDHVIRYWASVHAALRGERSLLKRTLRRQGKSPEEIKETVSNYHKASAKIGEGNGHGISKSNLFMRCPPPYAPRDGAQPRYTAQGLFWDFVERRDANRETVLHSLSSIL
jgi:pimeloyl-ACP methyl ester carboxylesterase